MSRIENTVLEAIDILTKANIDNKKNDVVIMAKITSCQDKNIGKYRCNYQGAVFSAYSSHPILTYDEGDNVYILNVAEDVTGNSKIIIGKRY